MKTLVSILREIEVSNLPDNADHVLQHKDHNLVSMAQAYATLCFVQDGDFRNYDEMDRLHDEYGYTVFPADQQRVGPATGVIRTKKGLIVFG